MWVSTVRSDKNSRSAICRLVRSAAMSRAISSCLLVSSVPEASQVVGQGGQRQAGRQVMDAQGAEHRLRHQQRIADRVQQDQPGAAWEIAGHLSGGPQGQLGLPGTAAAGQGQQAGGTQQPLDLAKLLPTPHEAGHLGRQVGQLTSHGSGLPTSASAYAEQARGRRVELVRPRPRLGAARLRRASAVRRGSAPEAARPRARGLARRRGTGGLARARPRCRAYG